MDIQTAASRGKLKTVKNMLAPGSKYYKNWHMTRSPLCLAASNGHKDVVQLLIEEGKHDPDETDDKGRTPLSWAAQRGCEGVVSFLLTRTDVYVDATDNMGWTPLSWAAGEGHVKIVKWLLQRGANVNAKDTKEQTPMLWAAMEGQKEVVKILLADLEIQYDAADDQMITPFMRAAARGTEKHIDVMEMILSKDRGNGRFADIMKMLYLRSKDKKERTALSWAAGSGSAKAVKFLLRENDDITQKDITGRTPLSWAAGAGHRDVVNILLRADDQFLQNLGKSAIGPVADPNARSIVDYKDEEGRSALHYAAQFGHDIVAKLLVVTRRASINCKDNEGRTPLSLAAGEGRHTMVKLLLEKGQADPEIVDNKGQTPMSWAAKEGHRVVVCYLLEHKALPDHERNDLRRPLSLAAEKGSLPVAALLLSKDEVQKDAEDKSKSTALMWATRGGHEKMVKMLLDKGAHAVQDAGDSDGLTLLMWAARVGHQALVTQFLEKGADVTAADKRGLTPLMWAATRGHNRVVDHLLNRGADIETRARTGQTALMMAASSGQVKVVELLVARGADVEAKNPKVKNWTAFTYAEGNKHNSVQTVLEKVLQDKTVKAAQRDLAIARIRRHSAIADPGPPSPGPQTPSLRMPAAPQIVLPQTPGLQITAPRNSIQQPLPHTSSQTLQASAQHLPPQHTQMHPKPSPHLPSQQKFTSQAAGPHTPPQSPTQVTQQPLSTSIAVSPNSASQDATVSRQNTTLDLPASTSKPTTAPTFSSILSTAHNFSPVQTPESVVRNLELENGTT